MLNKLLKLLFLIYRKNVAQYQKNFSLYLDMLTLAESKILHDHIES